MKTKLYDRTFLKLCKLIVAGCRIAETSNAPTLLIPEKDQIKNEVFHCLLSDH